MLSKIVHISSKSGSFLIRLTVSSSKSKSILNSCKKIDVKFFDSPRIELQPKGSYAVRLLKIKIKISKIIKIKKLHKLHMYRFKIVPSIHISKNVLFFEVFKNQNNPKNCILKVVKRAKFQFKLFNFWPHGNFEINFFAVI